MIRIDILPDDVLLEIFDFYVKEPLLHDTKSRVEAWYSLVHVCRRWRSLVFGSPHRLNLQLYCTPKILSRATLDAWPALPLLIRGYLTSKSDTDNIIVALEHSNRICEVHLWETGQMEKVLAAMQVSFPVRIELYDIPHSGYFSPEAMVALLSVLSSLESLSLDFRSPQSRSDLESRRPPPSKRLVIPSLTRLVFKGVSEYSEDLLASIDAPQLDYLDIIFFNQIDFNSPQLAQFINRTPKCRACDEAHVQFYDRAVEVKLMYRTHESDSAASRIVISCIDSDWQLLSITQVCNSSLRPLSIAEVLYIEHRYRQLVWKDDAAENTLWLELLLSFTAMKNLYLSKEVAPGIAVTLQELVRDGITEVLPSLQNVFVEKLEPSGRFQEKTGEFVAARQLSGHPVAISVWN